ncbi:hypothetical protein RhiLY_08763 [Ceratobasidium sp. AG-Ba]|nr:hypothetical protein RhiLY_08763 [Ceratobasidium sp. AG-Ba]
MSFEPHPKLTPIILYTTLVDHIAQPGSIDWVILQLEDILGDTEENDPFRFIIFRSLYFARGLRFRLQGSPMDIDEAIGCCHKALSCNQTLCTPGDKVRILCDLAESHIGRNTWTNSEDIDSAIHRLEIALRLESNDQPRPLVLHLAGGALYVRFERFGELEDLNCAIALQKQAIFLVPSSDGISPSWLEKLSLSMAALFEHTKERAVLAGGVGYIKQAIEIAGPDHRDKNRFLNTLGHLAYARHQHTSQSADLDESVYHLNSALEIPPVEIPGRLDTLTLLGRALQERFLRERDPTDIDRSIRYHRQRLEFELRKGHIVLPFVCSDYGNALESRFNHQREASDLRNAIWCYSKALAICPEDDPERSEDFNHLGNSLTQFSEISKEVSHVDAAILYFREAMSILISNQMENSTRIAYISGNLGQAYRLRFNYLEECDDLDNAIVHLARSAQILPETYIGLARIYAWLVVAHKLRFYATKDPEDASVAMQCYHLASVFPARSSLDKMNIALNWARFCNPSEIALDPYQIVIDSLTSVVSVEDDD